MEKYFLIVTIKPPRILFHVISYCIASGGPLQYGARLFQPHTGREKHFRQIALSGRPDDVNTNKYQGCPLVKKDEKAFLFFMKKYNRHRAAPRYALPAADSLT
jgi:hypothetical protein